MFDLIHTLEVMKPYNILLIQACIVILIPFLLWRTLKLSKFLPLGVVQIFAGVLLGPAIFGALFPDLFKVLFGTFELVKEGKVVGSIARADGISAVATIAVCLFGFLAGADADKNVIAKSGPSIASIGVIGMAIGWSIASTVGYFIYSAMPQSHFPDTSRSGFTLAFGLLVAVSALPLLAVILRDLDFTRKRIGAVALASAGIADTMMWLGLAIVVALSVIGGDIWHALLVAGLGGALSIGFIKLVAGPILDSLFDSNAPESAIMTLTALSILVASAITSITDLHPVLGAFVAGIFLPDRARELAAHRLDQTTVLVLMPFFFLFSGLRTNFSFSDPNVWILFAICTVLSLTGKAIGHAIGARLTGENWPLSLGVGLLLQSKGIMGLIVCNVFYDKQIVSPLMFSAAVLMCLATTGIPTFILRWAANKYGTALTQGDKKDAPLEIVAAPASSKPVLARLEFGDDRDPISITKPSVVIGRQSTDDIRLEDVRVSRSHVLLTIEKDGRARLKNQTADRSEPNPVTVNGVYQEDAEIKDGDKISVGGFDFTYREALDAAARRMVPA